MRLVSGSLHNEGQMELCINGVWGAVCLYPWNSFTTKLICKQLGYQEYGSNIFYSDLSLFVFRRNTTIFKT